VTWLHPLPQQLSIYDPNGRLALRVESYIGNAHCLQGDAIAFANIWSASLLKPHPNVKRTLESLDGAAEYG
jgi:hypothetical protein